MKIKLIAALFLFAGQCFAASYAEYYQNLKQSEGYRNKPYRDSHGWAVGIGHFSPKKFPKSYYTDAEIESLFKRDLSKAISLAKQTFPSFDKQPDRVKIILVSLSFNMGNGVKDFVKFRKYIEKRDYNKAAAELKDSKWYSQTGIRGKRYVRILKEIA